jgi:hypothetical protein
MKEGSIINPHRMFNGVFIPDWLCSREDVTMSAKLVYGRLLRYAGADGKCYPKTKTLMHECGISEKSLFNALNVLESNALIKRDKDENKGNIYYFLAHRWMNNTGTEKVDTSNNGGNTDSNIIQNTVKNDTDPTVKNTATDCKNYSTPTVKITATDCKNYSRSIIRNKESHIRESYSCAERKNNQVAFTGKSKFTVNIPDNINRPEVIEAYQLFVSYMMQQFKTSKSIIATEMDLQKLSQLQDSGNDPVQVIQRTIHACGREFFELPKPKQQSYRQPVQEEFMPRYVPPTEEGFMQSYKNEWGLT